MTWDIINAWAFHLIIYALCFYCGWKARYWGAYKQGYFDGQDQAHGRAKQQYRHTFRNVPVVGMRRSRVRFSRQ